MYGPNASELRFYRNFQKCPIIGYLGKSNHPIYYAPDVKRGKKNYTSYNKERECTRRVVQLIVMLEKKNGVQYYTK